MNTNKLNLWEEIVGWAKFGFACVIVLVGGLALLALLVLSVLSELGFRWGIFA